jgi:hypothetical protein
MGRGTGNAEDLKTKARVDIQSTLALVCLVEAFDFRATRPAFRVPFFNPS